MSDMENYEHGPLKKQSTSGWQKSMRARVLKCVTPWGRNSRASAAE
ncbi:hypothetical protein AB0I94_22870 [Streptomyces sp. NPDC050147]